MQRIPKQRTRVFCNPYSTVLNINVPLKRNYVSSIKNKLSNTNLFHQKKKCCELQNYCLTGSKQKCSKTTELVLNDSANDGGDYCRGAAASYIMLASVLVHAYMRYTPHSVYVELLP